MEKIRKLWIVIRNLTCVFTDVAVTCLGYGSWRCAVRSRQNSNYECVECMRQMQLASAQ